jgi:hypothetical protein
MQRSSTQVLFNYLPGAVFAHEDEFIAQVHHVRGDTVHNLNKRVLLDELSRELGKWDPAHVGLPDPGHYSSEYVMIEPQLVSWDVFPLTFECTNPSCGRIRRWWSQSDFNARTSIGPLRCAHCRSKSRMRQLRYVTAHNCGQMDPLFTPSCRVCGTADHVYLEDQGSFRSSVWKCRNCGGTVQSTRFTPCNCGEYARSGGRPYRTSFTVRDKRLWYPQMLTILNISSQTYDNFQQHPQRGVVAAASWIGDATDIAVALGDVDRSTSSNRMSEDEWMRLANQLRTSGVDDEAIEELRRIRGPVSAGVPATALDVSSTAAQHAESQQFVERAGLFDSKIISDRLSLDDVRTESATDPAGSASAQAATILAESLGLSDISVTQQFPIVLASYGYTRSTNDPHRSHLRTYAIPGQYSGKTPIFTVPALTEALVVTLSARSVIGFLASEQLWVGAVPVDERGCRIALLEAMATNNDTEGNSTAATTRRLVHSLSHALARSLDDGETGFGESSLAEWVVTDALTTAIYVATYNTFTLGAFETVVRRRITPWLNRAVDAMNRCDNDPLCSQQRPHAACDRCLYLSFGCRSWNADLDRKLLRRFWRWTRQQRTQRNS